MGLIPSISNLNYFPSVPEIRSNPMPRPPLQTPIGFCGGNRALECLLISHDEEFHRKGSNFELLPPSPPPSGKEARA